MGKRYLVERRTDVFEVVGAESLTVQPGGALVFLDPTGNLVVAYGAGQWLTVVPEDD